MDNCVNTALFGTVCDSCDGGAIYKILAMIIKILSTGVGVLAVLGIIIGGVIYLTSSGDASRMAKAKKRITEVVIGLIVYGVMFTVLEFLIPGGVLNSTLDSSTTSCPAKQEYTPPTTQTETQTQTGTETETETEQPTSEQEQETSTTCPASSSATSDRQSGVNLKLKGTGCPAVTGSQGQKFDAEAYATYLRNNYIKQDKYVKDVNGKIGCARSSQCLSFALVIAGNLAKGKCVENDAAVTDPSFGQQYKATSGTTIESSSLSEMLSKIKGGIDSGHTVMVKTTYHTNCEGTGACQCGSKRHYVVALSMGGLSESSIRWFDGQPQNGTTYIYSGQRKLCQQGGKYYAWIVSY